MPSRQLGTASGAPAPLWLLVGIMALIEGVLTAADSGWYGSFRWRGTAVLLGGFWPDLLWNEVLGLFAGQRLTMFLSHAFLHGNMIHFIMNGAILLALGKLVADRIGSALMLLLFAASAIGGAVCFGLLAQVQGPMIGASGAVFGFIGLWQYWEFARLRRRGQSLRPVASVVLVLVGINVVMAVALGGGLAWQAHLGGFVTGVLLGPLFDRLQGQGA